MKAVLKKILYKLFCILPINNNIITFESFSGKKYADNPRAIYEKMKDMKLNYKYKWFMNRSAITTNIPKNEIIYKGTIKWLYYTAISRAWVKNTGSYGGLKKRNNQLYIQTWHGIPIKKMGLDVESNINSKVSLQWDIVISPNKYYNKCLNSSLGNKLNYLEIGYPRNDIFYNYKSDMVITLKKKLGIALSKKVILYAPTFRNTDLSKEKKIDENHFKYLSDKYIVLYKAHQFQKTKSSELANIIDVSNYDDIAELMIISDILVTDYSSVLFDYLNLRKPIIFFAYDLEYYRDVERGFYIDYETLPGPIVKTPEELVESIENINNYWLIYNKKYKTFIKKYCLYEDGKASDRAVNYIIDLIEDWR